MEAYDPWEAEDRAPSYLYLATWWWKSSHEGPPHGVSQYGTKNASSLHLKCVLFFGPPPLPPSLVPLCLALLAGSALCQLNFGSSNSNSNNNNQGSSSSVQEEDVGERLGLIAEILGKDKG